MLLANLLSPPDEEARCRAAAEAAERAPDEEVKESITLVGPDTPGHERRA